MGARPLDLSLYLVTDAALCRPLGVAHTVARAVAGGVSAVQLRDPHCSDEEFVSTARAVHEVLEGTDVPLILNDRVHLVGPTGADGAHIGQGDLDPVRARELLGSRRYLGLSVQTPEHLAAALTLPRETLDYLGVGPVWPQTTKPDAAEPCSPAVLAAIADASPWPCVAIGGVDRQRVATARRAGAAGVAVVSAVCAAADAQAAAAALRGAWEQS